MSLFIFPSLKQDFFLYSESACTKTPQVSRSFFAKAEGKKNEKIFATCGRSLGRQAGVAAPICEMGMRAGHSPRLPQTQLPPLWTRPVLVVPAPPRSVARRQGASAGDPALEVQRAERFIPK